MVTLPAEFALWLRRKRQQKAKDVAAAGAAIVEKAAPNLRDAPLFADIVPRLSNKQINDLIGPPDDQEMAILRQDPEFYAAKNLSSERVDAIRLAIQSGELVPEGDAARDRLLESLAYIHSTEGRATPISLLSGPLTFYAEAIGKPFTAVALDAIQRILPGDQQFEMRVEQLQREAGLGFVEARLQAYRESTLPGWVKFGLESILDPLIVGGIAKAPATALTRATSKASGRRVFDLPTMEFTKKQIDPSRLSQVVGKVTTIFDPSATARDIVRDEKGVVDLARSSPEVALNLHTRLRTMGDEFSELAMASARSLVPARHAGNVAAWFGIKDGRMVKLGLPSEVDVLRPAWGDVFQNPRKFQDYLDSDKIKFIDEIHKVADEVKAMYRKEGLDLDEINFLDEMMHYVPRRVVGKKGVKTTALTFLGRAVGNKANFEKSRFYEEMDEGMRAGLEYADPLETMRFYLQSAYKRVADKRLKEYVEPLSRAAEGEVPKLGESVIRQPAFAGRIFTRETADAIEASMREQSIAGLGFLSNMAGTQRTLMTTTDFLTPFIQSFPLLFRNPAAWGKAVGYQFDAFRNPSVRANYLKRNAADIADFIQNGGLLGSSEFFESLQAGGWLAKVHGRFAGFRVQTFGRFEASFETNLDVGRIEMWKALRNTAKKSGREHEAADFVNKLLGQVSTKNMGVNLTQRQIESSIFFFSPRYTRAVGALLLDMTRGGLRGHEARWTIGSMVLGATAAYYGVAKALGQEPVLDPRDGNFMTIEAGGRRYGPGGKMRSFLRLAGEVWDQTFRNTAGLVTFNLFRNIAGLVTFNLFGDEEIEKNAMVRWLRQQSAPPASMAWDIVTGADAAGRTIPYLRENPLRWALWLETKFMPIALQAALEEGHFEPAPGAAELAAPISFPVSAFERQEKTRNDASKKKFNRVWKDLDPDEQAAVRRESESVRSVEQEANLEGREFKSSKRRIEAFDAIDRAKVVQVGEIAQAAAEFDSGAMGSRRGFVLRKKLGEAGSNYGSSLTTISETFRDVLEKEDDPNATPFEKAYNEFLDQMYLNGPEDEFGNRDWGKIDQVRAELVKKHSASMIERVEKYFKEKKAAPIVKGQVIELPQSVVELYEAREALRPYWELADSLSEPYRSMAKRLDSADPLEREALLADPFGARFQSVLDRLEHLQYRWLRTRPDEDWMLVKFYDRAPVHPNNIRRLTLQRRLERQEVLRSGR